MEGEHLCRRSTYVEVYRYISGDPVSLPVTGKFLAPSPSLKQHTDQATTVSLRQPPLPSSSFFSSLFTLCPATREPGIQI